MAQMKAYSIQMKNWTQICMSIVFCSREHVQFDVRGKRFSHLSSQKEMVIETSVTNPIIFWYV